VDRLGNAWSDQADDVSYRRFAADLAGVLKKLHETDVILVSFASASISARLFYQQHQQDFTVKALLYIDPDVPQPLSLSLYQGYPVDWYQASLDDLLPHLATGAWTERTAEKLENEQEHASSLIPPALHQLMDWQYYQQVSQRRLLITHQQSRAREIAAYSADLQAYAALAPVTAIPVSVMDTDFETADLPADAEQAARLLMWQQEGTAWSMEQAVLSNGQYIALTNSDHLVPLQQPEQIKQALDWLFSQLQLP
jgi:pimeloyl-ACP methyl ester carboxylesterase